MRCTRSLLRGALAIEGCDELKSGPATVRAAGDARKSLPARVPLVECYVRFRRVYRFSVLRVQKHG
jgi:hypothetical protein